MRLVQALLLAFTCVLPGGLRAQKEDRGFEFFPRSTYFEAILLDPNECQVSIGVHKMWRHQNQVQSGFYIPGNIGFQQAFIRLVRNAHSGVEIGMSAGAFAQFSIERVENNQLLAEMINTDYKATLFVHYGIRQLDLRVRLFHTSSHLSDDYIYRHQITETNNGLMNYEQLDFTASLQRGNSRYYAGMGMVITPHAVRRRLSTQMGYLFRQHKAARPNCGPVASMDVQMLAQNDFHPNVRSGIGIELGDLCKTHIVFLLEYFYGHIPYSTIDYGTVQWLGISTRLLPPWSRKL